MYKKISLSVSQYLSFSLIGLLQIYFSRVYRHVDKVECRTTQKGILWHTDSCKDTLNRSTPHPKSVHQDRSSTPHRPLRDGLQRLV